MSYDRILRTMTDDSSFRVVTADSSSTVSGVLEMQQASGKTAKHLADLVTGSIIIRETMAPSLRVQGILKRGGRRGYLLADSHPSGDTRALVGAGGASGFELEGAVLQMMRTLHNGQLQRGVVAVPDGADVSQALMVYMQESEQITTMIAVSSQFREDSVRAGGYLVQLLPGAARGALAVMTERLEDFRNIDQLVGGESFTPTQLMEELLFGMPFTQLGDSGFRAGCWCTRSGMLGALATLGREEIQSMVDDGELLDISCDYCHKQYRVAPTELTGLLTAN
jgi:molecular chaperone Hsp33